jgi:hypothetical protein
MQIEHVRVLPIAPLLVLEIKTVLSAHDVIDRLRAFIVPEPLFVTYRRELRSQFLGKISGTRFRMRRRSRNPGVPIILGRVTPTDRGSIVRITFLVPDLLFVFLCVIGCIAFTFGRPPELAVVPGVMALILLVPTVVNFRGEVRRSLMALRHVAHAGSAPQAPAPSE